MTILFSDVVLLLDRIAKTRSKTPLQHLEEWLSLLTGASHHQGLLLFRLIFPEHDVRRRYGLKETLLARELQKALGFASKSLQLWNDSRSDIVEDMDAQKRRAGCFGNTLEAILAVRRDATLEYPSLALERLDILLDELASHCEYSCRQLRAAHVLGPNKRHRARSDILYDLFSPLSAREAYFLSQIILRDLSPLLYPLPTVNQERALLDYNSNYYKPLEIHEALKAWNWALPSIWRFRSDLDAAFAVLETNQVLDRRSYTDQEAEKLLRRIALPAVGTRIEIPKAAKGRSLRSVAEAAEQAGKVWLETKYDGERMQIHIDLDAADGTYLKIFSKSKRDSTQDRILTHPLILSALNLPHSLSPASPPSAHLLRRAAEAARSRSHEPIRSITLEAEMVPYDEAEGKIDEFGTLPDCTGPSAQDSHGKPDLLDSSQTSASSILSAIAPQRHLAIVFFDILSLNGQNLLFDSYDQRRNALESVIRPIEGYSMLAERTSIDFNTLGSAAGYETLVRAFARATVDRQEGLMLKPASSTYNDRRRGQQWIKLKRDYIPGLGDTASFLIVGAAWSKERGRELNVPNTCFTTFFIGLLENGWEVENGIEAKPRYHVLFSVEHFPSRGDLLNANRKVAERGGVDTRTWSNRVGKSWSFNLSFSTALVSRPTFILSKPLVFELFGASFVKPRGTPHYVLRFPRVSAIHHTRTEKECADLRQLQVLAREACSFVESEAEEEVDDLWRRFSGGESGSEAEAPSRDKLTAGWREKQEQEWYDKLIQADKPKSGRTRKRKNTNSPQVLIRKPNKKVVAAENAVAACEAFTAKMALSDAQDPDKTLVNPGKAPRRVSNAGLLLPPPLPSISPIKPRSTLISSSRSGSFVEFIALHPVQQDYFWTVFPRTVSMKTESLPIQTRMHCIDRVMEGAGWQRKVDQPSRAAITSQCRAGRIYTSVDQADALAGYLRNIWRPSGGDAARVSICDASLVGSGSNSEKAVLMLLEV